MSTTGVDAPQDAHPGPWYEMPERWFAYLRGGQRAWGFSNILTGDRPGIYRSRLRSDADLVSPFAIARVRRHPGDPVTYDVVMCNPQTREQIEVTRADADRIADAVNARCGYPRARMKPAIYSILTSFFWRTVDRRR
ncbi:MAG: hypothetical protein PHQ81_06810 [Methanofollis sp.]|nr:hypothetical protein [Methanofollis sp.]